VNQHYWLQRAAHLESAQILVSSQSCTFLRWSLTILAGGSIRVPAAFCGIYGLKPSVGRLPHGGLSGTHAGMENIIGAVGPMARSVEDMSLFCKVGS
jgi:hypothetical protein